MSEGKEQHVTIVSVSRLCVVSLLLGGMIASLLPILLNVAKLERKADILLMPGGILSSPVAPAEMVPHAPSRWERDLLRTVLVRALLSGQTTANSERSSAGHMGIRFRCRDSVRPRLHSKVQSVVAAGNGRVAGPGSEAEEPNTLGHDD